MSRTIITSIVDTINVTAIIIVIIVDITIIASYNICTYMHVYVRIYL